MNYPPGHPLNRRRGQPKPRPFTPSPETPWLYQPPPHVFDGYDGAQCADSSTPVECSDSSSSDCGSSGDSGGGGCE